MLAARCAWDTVAVAGWEVVAVDAWEAVAVDSPEAVAADAWEAVSVAVDAWNVVAVAVDAWNVVAVAPVLYEGHNPEGVGPDSRRSPVAPIHFGSYGSLCRRVCLWLPYQVKFDSLF